MPNMPRGRKRKFDGGAILESIGATILESGLWVMPNGWVVSAIAGRPGRVTIMVHSHDDVRSMDRNFGTKDLDAMRAFVEGRSTKAETRGALSAAAPELLAILREHLAWYDGGEVDEPDLISRTRAAIEKAGKPFHW